MMPHPHSQQFPVDAQHRARLVQALDRAARGLAPQASQAAGGAHTPRGTGGHSGSMPSAFPVRRVLFARDALLARLRRRDRESEWGQGVRARRHVALVYGGVRRYHLVTWRNQAHRRLGATTVQLVAGLERRLDVVVWRAGWCHTVRQATAWVSRARVWVNGQLARTPHRLLHPGDVVTWRGPMPEGVLPQSRSDPRVYQRRCERYLARQQRRTGAPRVPSQGPGWCVGVLIQLLVVAAGEGMAAVRGTQGSGSTWPRRWRQRLVSTLHQLDQNSGVGTRRAVLHTSVAARRGQGSHPDTGLRGGDPRSRGWRGDSRDRAFSRRWTPRGAGPRMWPTTHLEVNHATRSLVVLYPPQAVVLPVMLDLERLVATL